MIRKLLFLNGLLFLSACQNIPGFQIENRIVCTVSKDKAYIVGSTGGLLGGSAAVNQKDTDTICANPVPVNVPASGATGK